MAIPCRSGNLVSGRCLAVDVSLACLAILLEPAYTLPSHRRLPVLALRLATTQQRRRTKIWEGGRGGRGGPLCTELLPRHLRTIHGDGAWRGSRYLKLRRCFINAGLPTLVRTRPLLVPFPFPLRLLPSHCGPQLSTLRTSSLRSLCVSPSRDTLGR